MKKRICAACMPVLLVMLGHGSAVAQQAHVNLDWAPQKNSQNLTPFMANVISPEVSDTGMVTFRVKAPAAQTVLLSAPTIAAGLGTGSGAKPWPFTKGADGVWSLTIGPVPANIYVYKFVIDGATVPDPNNTLTGFADQPGFSQLVVHVAIAAVFVASVSGQQRPGPKQGTARPPQAAGPRVIANEKTAIVKTQYGDIRGFVHDGIHNYKGIQYARAQRFQVPEAPEAWQGVKTALSDVKVCPIDIPNLLPDEIEFAQAHHWGFETEDCLRLNIWTPGITDGRKRPVMVWLHGGGYSGGSSIELPFYDGVNHRLNVLGFLDLSAYGEKYALSGNIGIVDLVAALKWVNGNIAGFGGDPGNVMIFGQSGGGGKVSTLLAAPSAKGLFHKAAVQSGSLTNFGEAKAAKEVAVEVLAQLKIQPSDVDEIQKVPYRQLMAAANVAVRTVRERRQKAGGAPAGGMGLGWAPIVDGSFLPYQGNDPRAIAISQNVPVLVGSNATEFASSAMRGASAQDVDGALAKRYGAKKEAYVQAFKKAYPKYTAPEYLVQVDHLPTRGHPAGDGPRAGQGGAGLRLPVRVAGAGPRRHVQEHALSRNPVCLQQHRLRAVPHGRRAGGVRARGEGEQGVGAVRADQQSQSPRPAGVARLHAGERRDDGDR